MVELTQDFLKMMAPAELHSDLIQYKEELSGFDALRHPLVFSVPYLAMENNRLNLLYEKKKQMLAKAIADNDLNKIVFLHERPYRLEAFVEHSSEVSDETYWSAFASIWIDTENFFQNHSQWHEMLLQRPNSHLMMSAEEIQYLNKLPDEVTIYRGTKYAKNGMSWSVSKDRAKWFANRVGGSLYVTTVHKENIFAYFNRRDEDEIVIDPSDCYIELVK